MRAFVLFSAAVVIAAVPLIAAAPAEPPRIEKNKLSITNEQDIAPEIKRIEELIALSSWDEALRAIASTKAKYGSALMRVDPDTCRGVSSYLRSVIEQLPSEGAAAYRRNFDLEAEALYNEAVASRDVRKFERVARDYFMSSYGDDAMLAVADEALVRGDWRLAADSLAKILSKRPDTTLDVPAMEVRLAYAYAKLGRPEPARGLASGAGEKKALVAGRSMLNKEMIIQIATAVKTNDESTGREPGVWNALGGSASRDALPAEDVVLGKPLSGLEKKEFRITQVMPTGFYFGGPSFDPSASRLAYPFFPVCDGKTIFLATGQDMVKLDFATGKPCGQIIASSAGTAEHNKEIIYAPTIADGTVYVNALGEGSGGEKHMHIDVTVSIPRRHLLGFDIATGKKVFDAEKTCEKVVDFDMMIFASPAIVADDRIFVSADSLRGFVDNHVLAFDRNSGELVWRRAICSNIIEITTFGYHAREPVPPMLTEKDGVLYALTNLGVMAALESDTGEILWTYEYEQIKVKPPINYTPQMRAYHWQPAPAVLSGGVVVFAPSDSPNVYGLNASDGSLVWKVCADDVGPDLYHFLGVSNGLAVVAGDRAAALNARTGKLVWATPGIIRMRESGRGQLTRTAAYVPAADALYKFDLKTGKLLDTWEWPKKSPLNGSEDAGRSLVEPGNIFIFGSRLVITTQNGIEILEGFAQ
jgi:outer membrane protein assembly factor BamB